MNGLWKKRVPAFLLTLVMIISLSPMALAEDPDPNTPDTSHSHVWGSWATTKQATCVNAGLRVRTCTASDCNESEEEEIPATGAHNWQFKSTTATCGAPGIRTEICSECGQSNTSNDPATGKHDWRDNGAPTQEATCGQPGIQPQICGDCGQAQDKTIPATGRHEWKTTVVTPATCTAQGSKQDTCEVCGKIETAVAIPALGHTAPDANGKCTRCKETIQTHVHQKKGGIQSDATHHWYNCTGCSERLEEAVHGTANADGKCPTCGYVLHTHSWAKEWTTNATSHWHACTGASCTAKSQEGAHTFVNNVCSVCKYVNNANTFTVRFFNGSTVVSTQNVAQNAYPTVPGNPAKTGCTFRGWLAYNPNGALYTTGTVTVDPSKTAITRATDYYAIFSVNATGQNATIAAATNIGSTLWTQIKTKCSTFGLTPVFVRFSLGDSRYGSLYTSSTQSSSYAVSASSDYTSNQVSSMTFKAGSSSGNYALGYTAFDNTTSNKVTGTIYITSDSVTAIPYSVSAGKSVSFSRKDFQNLCRDRVGGTLSYVTFSKPGSEYDDYGAVYNSSSSLTRSDLSGSYAYYDKADAGRNDYYLDNLSFKADSNAKNGTLTLSFTGYNTSRDRFEGSVEITVKGGTSKGDVTYNADPGKEVDFDSRDFNRAFQDKYGSTRTDLFYVSFTAPSSYTSFRGSVRVGSSSLDRTDLNTYNFYYNSKDATGKNDYALDRMSFRADSNAKNGDSITIPFRAYYGTGTNSYVECSLVITIGNGSVKGDINYDVAPGKTVTFKQRDFRDFYEDNTSSGTLDYVEFDQPASSAFTNGTLYHNYNTTSSKSFNRTTIDDFKFYYSPGSKDYGIGNLTFVAASSFKTTVTLDFTAYGTNGRSVSGTVSIASTESDEDGDITYTVTPGKSVDLRRTDFNTYFRKKYSSTVSYVVFARPSSTSIFNNGTLYCDYGTNSQTSFSRSDLSGTKFYYNKNDMGRNDYYLDELTFVAGTNFKDSITLDFTAYGERDDEYVEGTLVIKSDGGAAITSNYTGGIRYATTTGTNVQINANDIARYFRKSYPTYNLQYVTLGGVPAAGSLYYNYYNASSYGTTSRTQITSANYAGQSFYLSPSSTSQYALTELTYVPSGTSYCASIPFTAYGTSGISVTGSILISVSRAPVSEVYGVTPRNTAVSFPASAIYSAVLSATGSALSGIQLLELPAATTGAVYIGTGTDRADTRTMYTYAAGANQMSLLRFVPTASYTGSVEIPYVALDANGNALATGSFSLGVLNNRKTLTDVDSSTWCYKYVMELTDQNVISGYSDGSFKPNSTVTYGAALKLIMLAAGYPEQAPTGTNVFSGYLTRAQADGIVTRSNVNLSAPITRLQVAQLAAGALKLSTSNLSSVKPFTDTSDVYVQALNAAGIVEGYFSNGTSTYRPSNTLTRGQMSAIVWRMNEYRK